jgi:ADP-ribose pyrophosphatase YjhB (NUDIX family)
MAQEKHILNVFQKGLIRGSERLPHDPTKSYAYVEHPNEGWRVYLRSVIFIHSQDATPFRKENFLVVKRFRSRPSTATWEPPKGQMEGKDINNKSSILELLRTNVLREMEEESHITELTRMKYTGLVFQAQEADYPQHHYFQYHLFQGIVSMKQIKQSEDTFEWMKEHPKAVKRWRRDRREKDAVAWFNPRQTRLNPRWCPDIVALYLQHF